MKEEWKPAPYEGFDKLFMVSNYGKVKRLEHYRNVRISNRFKTYSRYTHMPEKIMEPKLTKKNPHLFCDLYLHDEEGKPIKRMSLYVHKAVGICFIEKPSPEHKHVSHKDQDHNNNHVDNLYWRTASEISIDTMKRNPHMRTTLKEANIKSGYYTSKRKKDEGNKMDS